ncbi:MAG: smalltalk protein [Prevotellaceae bacterium]|nr:smalltalk protein [Prevotella sp.]MDD7529578.1 smalltalk protein [Prevotellaceae bacterium]MDY2634581.1 smalltalk protein [Prevotella sp.]
MKKIEPDMMKKILKILVAVATALLGVIGGAQAMS